MNKYLELLKKYQKLISIVLIILSYPLIYIFVYNTGGSKFVFTHTMYIPILLAGAILGFKYGLLAGFIGGLILGPLMPLVVNPYEQQEFFNWFYRLIVFIAVGGLTGFFVDSYNRIIKLNNRFYSHHPDTDLYNINYLYQLDDNYIKGKVLVATVLINNKDKITEVLGIDMYIKAMKSIFAYITSILSKKNIVIQTDCDKFWIILHLDDIREDGKNIAEGLTNQIQIDDISIYIDYSIGISECDSFRVCKSLAPFRYSDQLANYAKSNNLPYVIYDQELILKKYEFSLLGMFQRALDNDETFLVYQPVVDANTRKIIGVEALLRWNNPENGLIMPDDFIPLIESTQLIHPMTEWVFRKTLQFQKKFINEGFNKFISINLSIKNITNPNFFNSITKIMKEEGGIASSIILEITESVLLEEELKAKVTLQKAKEAGFRIAIDDFGKGYSSLTYLCNFKNDFLKIDRGYINKIDKKESVKNIVEATIKLAHQFNLKVVAEGVETEEVFNKVRDLGIDFIQGYYIAKPMTEDDVIIWYHQYIK